MLQMGEFLKILLSLSFSGTFLFLIVFLVVRMYQNRLSRRWQYYIWLLVVFRFLIPLTFPHTVTGYLFRGADRIMTEWNAVDAVNAAKNAERKDVSESSVNGTADVPENLIDGADTASDAVTVSFREETGSRRMSELSFWAFDLWAAGALILLIRKITAYQSYMQFLRRGNAEVSSLETLNLLAEAEEKLKIKRAIELYRNPLITSPIMTGFIRPKIVIPDRKMTDEELDCIFTHELVHFKYFDMFYKWLVQITICVHWFNPFVYLLGKEVNKRCELSCDEKVIGALNEQERKRYGDTLLSFLKRGEVYQNPLASITLTEGAEQLIERLGAIMDYRKKSRKIMVLTTALTALICFFFSGIGAYAGTYAGRQDAEQKNRPEQYQDVKGKEDSGRQDVDYSLLYDEDANIYYILTEGAEPEDRPGGTVGNGLGIVLVWKSGYAAFSFDSFSVKFRFLSAVESQCRDAVQKGMISEAEAELIQDVAAQIAAGESPGPEADEMDMPREAKKPLETGEEQDGVGQKVEELKETHYSYFQQTWYKEPYVIEFGWNLGQEAMDAYAHTEILLNGQSRMTVYFSKEAEKWMEDAAAMEAVRRLTGELKSEARGAYGIRLEAPYVSNIVYLPADEIEDFAKKAFENGELADFSAVLNMLPEEAKEEYCERSYAEEDIGFFSVIISEMNDGYIRTFAERCYEKDDIDYFAVLSDDLTEKDRKEWMEKALQDGKDAYYYILKDKEDWGY